MQDKVDDILEHLEHTKQNLLDLSDDIWRTIDHRDNAEIEEGAAFQKEYNQAVAEFADAAGHCRAFFDAL